MDFFQVAAQNARDEFGAHANLAIVCAWCKRVVREGHYPASHTICASCSNRMITEATKMPEASQGAPPATPDRSARR